MPLYIDGFLFMCFYLLPLLSFEPSLMYDIDTIQLVTSVCNVRYLFIFAARDLPLQFVTNVYKILAAT